MRLWYDLIHQISQETNSPNGIGSFGYQFLPLPTHLTKFLLDKMALKRWDLSNKKFTISAPIKQMLEYDSDYLHLHLHFLSLSVVNFSKFKNDFGVFWLKTTMKKEREKDNL